MSEEDWRIDVAIKALQKIYRKQHLGDDSLGWAETDDICFNALCDLMGDKEYNKWVHKVAREIKERQG